MFEFLVWLCLIQIVVILIYNYEYQKLLTENAHLLDILNLHSDETELN